MRLEKIKLSGFKSFVDPTTIPVSSNLMGIVGPNGCGKSNIIDAVRWVMGESSAKHLRGDTMADVIFNGSSTRKPVGVASVELVFDNSEAGVGGEYAGYNTIAIKRQVSRDGQSLYSLNGTRCRRKDITGIFLGTGLGSRSYAIIEQGTISRLIEAKPDDLRVLIEEAAGVSKYKERRHETEIRIRHTRENLERLDDVRDEVENHINHLKRQAKKAEKYTTLKANERRYKQELLAIRWRSYDKSVQEYDHSSESQQQGLADALQGKAELEGSLSRAGETHAGYQQKLNAVQGELYGVSSEIGRLEQTIESADQLKQEIQDEIDRLKQGNEQALDDLDQDRAQLDGIKNELIQSDESLKQAILSESEAAKRQQEIERKRRIMQAEWDDIKVRHSAAKEISQIECARIEQFVEQDEQYCDRHRRLQTEFKDLSDNALATEIEKLNSEIDSLKDMRSHIFTEIVESKSQTDLSQARLKALHEELNKLRSEQRDIQGKVASLETLQQHATGQDRTEINVWLMAMKISDAPRLAQEIDVQPGWETAVEAVLDIYLESLCLIDEESVLANLDSLPSDSLAMIGSKRDKYRGGRSKHTSLSDKVKSPWNVETLLTGIYCADDLAQARAICAVLEDHESVITADGVWLGPGWVCLKRGNDGRSGVIKREKDLRVLKEKLTQLHSRHETLESELTQVETNLSASEKRLEGVQAKEQSLSTQISELKSQLSARSAKFEQFKQRLEQIEIELEDINTRLHKNGLLSDKAENNRHNAEQQLSELAEQNDRFSQKNTDLEVVVEQINQETTEARDAVHRFESRMENLHSSEKLTTKHLDRLEKQHQQEVDRIKQLCAKLNATQSPIDRHALKLNQLLEQRAELERKLKAARLELTENEQSNTALSEQRVALERQIDQKREQLEQVRMDSQASRVRSQAILEQLVEMNIEPQTALENIPADADEQVWHETVEELAGKLERLGAINLAAVEEHDEQAQRLDYLNSQHKDLTESLETLERAMNKIDQESKSRFKSTFDQINAGLQRNFPKLFGGGKATLELTEQNLLETGVNVIAQPPGKRNSSIHLLSGGEKALTAVALVFSIFELNPAPFCLLDEVDAPLDDANIGRFRQLVEEMSLSVQFVFITHNKATMEAAQHLVGVTMEEPGVSRMVAVDIDEAVKLAVG